MVKVMVKVRPLSGFLEAVSVREKKRERGEGRLLLTRLMPAVRSSSLLRRIVVGVESRLRLWRRCIRRLLECVCRKRDGWIMIIVNDNGWLAQ